MKKFLLVVVLLLLGLAGTLRLRYGGGAAFPNLLPAGTPLLTEIALEVVAELPTPPGNIAVAPNGRVFITLHPEARPQLKVVELVDGKPQAFPNMAFQTGENERRFFRDVLSLRIDAQQRLWTLDNGGHGLHPGRLLAFDIASGEVVHEFEFPRELAGLGSHLNDFNISPDGLFIYIADASFFAKTPALVVYDVQARSARRLLECHPSVTAEQYTPVVKGRRMSVLGLVDVRPGVDSIALDKQGEWLYYAPVTSTRLYRVRAADLRDQKLSAAELAARVETYAAKTMSDGLTMDLAGNIYLTDLEHSALVLLKPDRSLQTLLQSERLRWPDGLSFGPPGWLYLSCSSLQDVIGKPSSSVREHAPYQVFRLRPGFESLAGQ